MRRLLLASVSAAALFIALPAEAGKQTCIDIGWVFTCPTDSTGDHDNGGGHGYTPRERPVDPPGDDDDDDDDDDNECPKGNKPY